MNVRCLLPALCAVLAAGTVRAAAEAETNGVFVTFASDLTPLAEPEATDDPAAAWTFADPPSAALVADALKGPKGEILKRWLRFAAKEHPRKFVQKTMNGVECVLRYQPLFREHFGNYAAFVTVNPTDKPVQATVYSDAEELHRADLRRLFHDAKRGAWRTFCTSVKTRETANDPRCYYRFELPPRSVVFARLPIGGRMTNQRMAPAKAPKGATLELEEKNEEIDELTLEE